MPLYDYRCEACEHEFEENRPIAQRDEAECPACRSRKVKRLLRSVGIIGQTRSGGGCAPRSGFT